MKVLHLIPSFNKGGSERLLLNICEHSANRGIETKIVYFFSGNDNSITSLPINIGYCKVHIQKSLFRKSIVEINEYEEIVDKFKPDIIHSHSFYTDIVSRETLRRKLLYISHFHLFIDQFQSFSINTLKSKKALTTYIDRQILFYKYSKFQNSFFLTVSDASDMYFRKILPRNLHKNIFKLPNAVNLDHFKYKNRDLPFNNDISLITVGRIVKDKNHIFLLEAVNYLKEIGYSIKLVILGSGVYKEELLTEIKKRKIEREVDLPGAVDRVEIWLERAHIYVHSSLSETFGISTLEAMASGLPCVVLDAIGNRELVKNGVNGFLLTKMDIKTFAHRIVELINSPELYTQMSQQSFSMSKNYSLASYMTQLENIYRLGLNKLHN